MPSMTLTIRTANSSSIRALAPQTITESPLTIGWRWMIFLKNMEDTKWRRIELTYLRVVAIYYSFAAQEKMSHTAASNGLVKFNIDFA